MTEPLEESSLHRALVMSNQLQTLPPSMLISTFVIDSALVAIFWLGRGVLSSALIVGLGVFVASVLNWELLRRLPQEGRSFGPDQPTALVVGAILALVAAVLGLLYASTAFTLIVLLLISAGAYYATWLEPFNITLTRQRLKLKSELRPDSEQNSDSGNGDVCLRILHLSDLHVERTSPRERRLNAMIASLQPDLIVFSGDFVNLSYTNDAQAKKDIRAIIGAWQAPFGVYCVPGTPNVEPITKVLEFVEGLSNLQLLANRWVTIQTGCGALHLLGLITTHNLKTDRQALATMMESAPSEAGLKLLLVHSPDLAPEAARAGFDLYLCGHTHGGQIRLPLIGALVSSSQYGKRFVMGRYQVGPMTLYTSRGLGMEGLGAPRARLFCPPEIILWEIEGDR